MKLLKLVCALKSGEDYPKKLFPKRNGRTFLDWDCLVFQLPSKEYVELAYSHDYTYEPNVLLTLHIMDRQGKHKRIECIQDLDEFIITDKCAVDIATEIMNGNLTAMNLRRYITP